MLTILPRASLIGSSGVGAAMVTAAKSVVKMAEKRILYDVLRQRVWLMDCLKERLLRLDIKLPTSALSRLYTLAKFVYIGMQSDEALPEWASSLPSFLAQNSGDCRLDSRYPYTRLRKNAVVVSIIWARMMLRPKHSCENMHWNRNESLRSRLPGRGCLTTSQN